MKRIVLFFFIFLIFPLIVLAQEKNQPILINQIMLEQNSGAKFELLSFIIPIVIKLIYRALVLKRKHPAATKAT